jgi:hypothetical protein
MTCGIRELLSLVLERERLSTLHLRNILPAGVVPGAAE